MSTPVNDCPDAVYHRNIAWVPKAGWFDSQDEAVQALLPDDAAVTGSRTQGRRGEVDVEAGALTATFFVRQREAKWAVEGFEGCAGLSTVDALREGLPLGDGEVSTSVIEQE